VSNAPHLPDKDGVLEPYLSKDFDGATMIPKSLTAAQIAEKNRKYWAQDDPQNPENKRSNENAAD
jgi:hypothetical protein